MEQEKDVKIFDKDELLYFDGKECRVIAEYERTICVEYVHYPFAGQEEEFPYPRVILRKGEVERAAI
ncbi:hypothetical protein CHL76_00495 [Marinococcus halophilus]|uniref:Uncharacterized protein n=1 Tax=Marinococcus halophilus TaxID=1371 RepID=A0A510Y2K6_MARHA|nr:hypothetical protein [Marinococcus halophilus]OZT81610.1 hypothetical protein CHL76_00495 [Marinococcus halophilus]GEK57555.1 hypothetical protein MHA01_04600 [Marinococcus halophilus]